jgi:hypothetical protein
LRELGFGKNQILTPSLHIPGYDVHGQQRPGQIRPDIPRIDGRKQSGIKYESPAGQSLYLDVSPLIRPRLSNPEIDLYITEGVRKADSAVSHGLCYIALMDVTGWRGTNEDGGENRFALLELHRIE